MEIFKISHGPWEKLFDGMFEKNPITIYSNPESVLMVLIFEKEGTKVTGVVIEFFQAFNVEGEVEGFIETLPREIVLLVRHGKKQTMKFLLLGSTPSYVEWKEETFTAEVDKLLKKLDNSSVIIKDISKAYDITLQEIGSATKKVKKAFFSDPLLVPTISSSYSEQETFATRISKGELIVGLTKDRHSIVEPLELFLKTLVTGGDEQARIHFMHVLSESFLLSNVSVVMFDANNYFREINSPTTKLEELQKYKISSEPIGFPLKTFKPDEHIKVDLNFINPPGFTQVFGAGKTAPTRIIASALHKNKVKGMNDLIEKIKFTPPTEEVNAYEVRKTIRILRLVTLRYPTLFEGKNDIEEITKAGAKTIGRAGIIDLAGVEPKIAFLIIHNLLKSILEYCKQKEESKGIKSVVVLPEITSLIPQKDSPEMGLEVEQFLTQLEPAGLGVMISVDKEIDAPQQVAKMIEAKVNIVRDNDIGVNLKGRKSYRVFLRPALSMCSEK